MILEAKLEGFLRVVLFRNNQHFFVIELGDKDFQDAGFKNKLDLECLLEDFSDYFGSMIKEKLQKEINSLKRDKEDLSVEIKNFKSVLKQIEEKKCQK